MKFDQAQDKREIIQYQRREELKFESVKWSIERNQREQAIDIFILIFRKQKKARLLISLIKIRSIILRLKTLVNLQLMKKRRQENIKKIERLFLQIFWISYKNG